MTNITDILDPAELQAELDAKNVRIQTHPDFPTLVIANYTDQCAFSRHWTDVTRTCRGLIWDNRTGEVLARPFPKFFNWDEKEAPRILDDQVVWHWADKADGSLGIVYLVGEGDLRIATRGSFASEQAKLGQGLLDRRSLAEHRSDLGMIQNGYTPLYEIVGPDNQIVLQYAENALVPLGYIHIGTGEFVPPAGAERRTMRNLLGDLSRSGAEGWVVWLSNRQAVKIKQADYIELHRMVSNLTPKEVWRQLRAGTYHEYIEQMPDELQALGEGWAEDLRQQYLLIHQIAGIALGNVQGDTRKEQAIWLQKNAEPRVRGLVFSLLDRKDISDSIWRMLEPSGREGM